MRDETKGFYEPTVGAIALEQIRLIATRLRSTLMVLSAMSVLVGVLVVREMSRQPVEFFGALSRAVVFLLMIVTLYMATAVWRGEGPSRRTYHWTLPVARGWHAWMRTGAGLLWLIAILLAGAIVPVVTGYLAPASLPAWAVCVTIVYLLTMIPTLLSDYPDRWVVAVIAFYGVGSILISVLLGPGKLLEAWHAVGYGRLGLATALSPGDLSAWVPAAALWLAIGVFGVGWAARRHPG